MFLFELIERRIKFELNMLGDIVLFAKNESPVIESLLFQLGFYIYLSVYFLVCGGFCFILGRILNCLFKLCDRLFDIAHLCIYGEDAIGRVHSLKMS
jgi:hypothetical protein